MGERKYYPCPWVRNCGMEKKNSLHCVESLWPDRALTSPPLIYSTAFLWMQSSQAGVDGCQLYICTVDIIDALYAYLHVISIWFCLFTLLVSETTKGLQIHQRNAQAQMEMGQESPGRQCEERDADAQTCFLLPSSTQNTVRFPARRECCPVGISCGLRAALPGGGFAGKHWRTPPGRSWS